MAEEVSFSRNYRNGFTVMSNDIFLDKEASLKDRGLLATMFSLPSDWRFSIAGLASILLEGKEAISTGLNNLERLGYLRREKKRNEAGQFKVASYDFYDYRHFNPSQQTEQVENKTNDGRVINFHWSDSKTQENTSSEPKADFPSTADMGQNQGFTSSEPKADFPSMDNPSEYNKQIQIRNNISFSNKQNLTSSDNVLPVQNKDLENTSSNNISAGQKVKPHDDFSNPVFHTIPTLEQVKTFVEERGIQLNDQQTEEFFDYYDKLGWYSENPRTGMKSPYHWGRKLLNWETRELRKQQNIEENNAMVEAQLAEQNERQKVVIAKSCEAKTPVQDKVETQVELVTPTVEDVEGYLLENGFSDVSAEKFVDYYERRNWIDKAGRYVNWQQKCEVWQKNAESRKLDKAVKKAVEPELEPPSITEVRAYVQENNLVDVDFQRFFRYYENREWTNVSNWKNRLELWDSRAKERREATEKQAQVAGSWEQSKAREKALDELQLLKDNLEFFNGDNEQDRKSRENINSQINELKEKWGIE